MPMPKHYYKLKLLFGISGRVVLINFSRNLMSFAPKNISKDVRMSIYGIFKNLVGFINKSQYFFQFIKRGTESTSSTFTIKE